MKVTLNWLKQYVEFDWSPDELAERLTMLGIEVEGVAEARRRIRGRRRRPGHHQGQAPQRRQAHRLPRQRRPGRAPDRLRRAELQGRRQGAAHPAGPHACPPSRAKPPFTIKVGKIRGVESHGMMCSPQELGLARPGRRPAHPARRRPGRPAVRRIPRPVRQRCGL